MSQGNSVILFDGVCNLCNASVDFVIKPFVPEIFRARLNAILANRPGPAKPAIQKKRASSRAPGAQSR